ncbi:carboxymuconolactone decarboxylase family protein [uncultured Phenylobacterium sp.]|uniref:carboxymuconolactone decarboxylase family protein n=1 Tax=uncultured Phenylobacterium sp. TaxID=349273 RepID=UPI0025FA8815|nr:carboxymuconolactone decarboxylase family protein [uncultured Phenylobacterium sp.]
MTQRLNPQTVAPKMLEPLLALETYLAASGLEHSLMLLVKTRASQINGCAYCLHMHTSDALAEGETAARLFLLDAWQESKLFTPREQAALAWTEALTHVSQTHAPVADYEALKAHFSDTEIVNLTALIASINSWNRISIGLRSQHPHDRPARKAAA